MPVQQINLVPLLDASKFTKSVEEECEEHGVSTHYASDLLSLNWGNSEWPQTKEWLVSQYGEEIKKYNLFSIEPT